MFLNVDNYWSMHMSTDWYQILKIIIEKYKLILIGVKNWRIKIIIWKQHVFGTHSHLTLAITPYHCALPRWPMLLSNFRSYCS